MNYSNNKSNYVDKSRFTIVDYPIVPNNDTTPITEIDYVNFGNVSNFGYNNARFSTWETALEVFENYVDNLNSKIVSLQAQIDELRESSQRTYVGFRWTGGAVTPETVITGQTAVLTRGTFEALYSNNTTESIPVGDIKFTVSSGRISGTTITPPILNSNEYGRTVYVYANYNGERQSISYTVTATTAKYKSLKAKIVNNGVEDDIESNVIQPVSPSSSIDISNIRIYGVDEFNNEDNITSSVQFTVSGPATLNGSTILTSSASSGTGKITLTAHYIDLSQLVKTYQLREVGPVNEHIIWTGGSVNAVDQNDIISTENGVITVYGGTEMTLTKGTVSYMRGLMGTDVTKDASFMLTANGISETIEGEQFNAPNISGECTISVGYIGAYNGLMASNVLTFKSIFRNNPPVTPVYKEHITWTGGSVNAVDQNDIISTENGVITVYGGTEMTLTKGIVTYINRRLDSEIVTKDASFILTANGISETIEGEQFNAPNISGECTISVSYNGMTASNVLTFKSIFRNNPPVTTKYAYAGVWDRNNKTITTSDFNITTEKPTSIHWDVTKSQYIQIFVYPIKWGDPTCILDGKEYNEYVVDDKGYFTIPNGYKLIYASGLAKDISMTWPEN